MLRAIRPPLGHRILVATGLLGLVVVLAAGCDGGSPSEPRPGEPPRGVTNATVLENLVLVRSLQDRQLTGTQLVDISGGVRPSGRLSQGSGWGYSFLQTTPQSRTVYFWSAYSDGRIESGGSGPPIGIVFPVDIGPLLQIDSDRALEIARANGAQAHLDRFPDGIITMRYHHDGNRLLCAIELDGRRMDGAPCTSFVFLDGSTGAVLRTDFTCLTL